MNGWRGEEWLRFAPAERFVARCCAGLHGWGGHGDGWNQGEGGGDGLGQGGECGQVSHGRPPSRLRKGRLDDASDPP